MRKYPRIEIDQKAYDGLQIEAVLQHKTAREIATSAILGYISKEALMVIRSKTTTPKARALNFKSTANNNLLYANCTQEQQSKSNTQPPPKPDQTAMQLIAIKRRPVDEKCF
jgi:hypothetical protein